MVRQCHSSWGLRGGDSTVREVLSRASVTCLLDVELGVVFSLVSRAGLDVFFGVKGVDDVLAGVEQGGYGGVYGDLAVDGFFFADFPRFSRSSGSSRS